MFDAAFVGRVSDVLNTHCVNGATITRAELCKELGLDSSFEGVISLLIKNGQLPGFESKKRAGIGRKGEPTAPRPRGAREPKAPTFEPEFVTSLADCLAALTEGGVRVTRDEVAQALGTPGSKCEILISQALKFGAVSGYYTVPGRNGGIVAGEAPAAEEKPRRSRKPVSTDETAAAAA